MIQLLFGQSKRAAAAAVHRIIPCTAHDIAIDAAWKDEFLPFIEPTVYLVAGKGAGNMAA